MWMLMKMNSMMNYKNQIINSLWIWWIIINLKKINNNNSNQVIYHKFNKVNNYKKIEKIFTYKIREII